MSSSPIPTYRVLFAGYAQVHFVSFLPIYRELAKDARLDIWFTGGFRSKHGRGYKYRLEGFYDPFDLPRGRIIPYSVARKRSYHVLFCSHLSQTLSPRHAEVRIQLFHGVSFKNCAITTKALKYDYLFVAGDYMRRRFVEQGLFSDDDPRLVMTGFAKVDRLADGSLDRAATLAALGLDPKRKTVLFAPTGHKHNALETHGEEIIRSLAAEGRYNLLVKPHDHPKDTSYNWREILGKHENRHVRAVWDPDVVPYLHAADLLVTDASSVSNEYSLMDRPIVFIDVPELLEKLVEKGVPLDLDTWGRKGGVIVKDMAELRPTVERLLAGDDAGADVRRAMARDIFHDPGQATQRAVQAVSQILESLEAPSKEPRPLRPLALPALGPSVRHAAGARS